MDDNPEIRDRLIVNKSTNHNKLRLRESFISRALSASSAEPNGWKLTG